MGRKILRKRRVFSLDPNKVAYSMFERNYVTCLMTSLAKISSNNPSNHHHHHQQNFEKLVKFEVDMAMAQSAPSEFAWGNALKQKLDLQRELGINGNGNGNGDFDFSIQTVNFPKGNLEREDEDEDEEKKTENGLMKLRSILPGGDGDHSNGDFEEDDLLKQTESYIKCLEMQVNVLRCLVDTNTN